MNHYWILVTDPQISFGKRTARNNPNFTAIVDCRDYPNNQKHPPHGILHFYPLQLQCVVHPTLLHLLPPEAQLTPVKLDAVTAWINTQILTGQQVFVHCEQGQSRSPAICIAYLMRYHNASFANALHEVQGQNPAIHLNIHWPPQLQAYHNYLHPPLLLAAPVVAAAAPVAAAPVAAAPLVAAAPVAAAPPVPAVAPPVKAAHGPNRHSARIRRVDYKHIFDDCKLVLFVNYFAIDLLA